MDTDEELPPGDTTTIYFVPGFVGGTSYQNSNIPRETALQVLISLCTSIAAPRQPAPDGAYIESLQAQIYDGLDKRIEHVRRWATANTAHFSSKNQDIRNLFDKLNTMALEMRVASRLCSAICSCGLFCLQVYGHGKNEHNCGNEHPDSVTAQPTSTTSHERTGRAIPSTPSSSTGLRISETTDPHETDNPIDRIRVQDLGDVSFRLPQKNATVLSLEWRGDTTDISQESIVLQVDETLQYGHAIWWISLERFPGDNAMMPNLDSANPDQTRFTF